FFQAEDGIRDDLVTGVQTCALPILEFAAVYLELRYFAPHALPHYFPGIDDSSAIERLLGAELDSAGLWQRCRPEGAAEPVVAVKIGRASCRERVRGEGEGGAGQMCA